MGGTTNGYRDWTLSADGVVALSLDELALLVLKAFVAMKEVEVQVRAKAGLGHDLVGTALMQKAFRPAKSTGDTGGPLFREELEGGESVALMNLFAGAIGLFKNPSSHRRVDLSDPIEAAEIVLLADLLLRLLRKIEQPAEAEG